MLIGSSINLFDRWPVATPKYAFFLGGHDLEMVTVRDVLERAGQWYCDKGLAWGARASVYGEEIHVAVSQGFVPVLMELVLDIELPVNAVVVDHHNQHAHCPASILQVLNLLGLTPTRWHELVAANDSGYIPGLRAMGANSIEIAKIRRADRAAQGVTPQMELDAEVAIDCVRYHGSLAVAHIPHLKPSPVTDRLFDRWPDGRENLLTICKSGGKVHTYYFGRGDICAELLSRFPQPTGFAGGQGLGSANANAFAGVNAPELSSPFVEAVKALASRV